MEIRTAKEMREIERLTDLGGISYLRLMENAGSAATAAIRQKVPVQENNIVVFCGSGNNGGDGFVVARRLRENGGNVIVVLTDGPPRSPEAIQMLELLRHTDIAVFDIVEDGEQISRYLKSSDIVVDAIYGTGFHGALDEKHRAIAAIINLSVAAVFALDLPSGLSADEPDEADGAVQADFTITFACHKPAHLVSPYNDRCGEVLAVDIGVPPQVMESVKPTVFLVDEQLVFSLLPPRDPRAHKGSHGRLLNIAGSRPYTGAALLSTEAALRSGAGYVTLATVERVFSDVISAIPHATGLLLKEGEGGSIAGSEAPRLAGELPRYSAVALGCGLGVNEESIELVRRVVTDTPGPLLIDADGINALALHMDILSERQGETLLTPHPAEMGRLCGLSTQEVQRSRVQTARQFAAHRHCTVVLKGYQTLVAAPDGRLYINTTGNAGLAKAGSGDLLAGMAGAFLAQGLPAVDAAVCAVYLHGAAADRCAARLSQYAMVGRDLLDDLAQIFLAHER